MEDGAGPRALAAAERAALARRRGPPSTRTLIEIALKQASACPHAGAGGARSRAISVRLESDDGYTSWHLSVLPTCSRGVCGLILAEGQSASPGLLRMCDAAGLKS